MGEPVGTTELRTIQTPDQAEAILPLETIKINTQNTAGEVIDTPLFHRKQMINKKQFWALLINKHGPLPTDRISNIASFLQHDDVQHDIRETHDKIAVGLTSIQEFRAWLTNLMVYPLFNDLLTSNTDSFQEKFDQWKETWKDGVTPEKFREHFAIHFRLLGRAPKNVQEWYVPHTKDQPIQEGEADFLAGLFERTIGLTHDPEVIGNADKRNRDLVQEAEKNGIVITPKDLFHTTDLATTPLIVDKGILATECVSLTQDGYHESTFSVSFHTFRNGKTDLKALGENLRNGPDTHRNPEKRVHLAFLNPSETINDEHIIYPPHSFYTTIEQSDKIAARYIGGYDGGESLFPDKAPAYALIGMPSTALSFAVIDEKLKSDYAATAQRFPFYVPAFSYEGKLLYTPNEYYQTKVSPITVENQEG